MRRLIIPFIVVLALAIPALASARAGTTLRAQLHELNGSGVNGAISVTLSGNSMTVRFEATGLEANQPHLRHIHGTGDGVSNAGGSGIQLSKCPTIAADANADGLISFAEGLSDYGGVAKDLGGFMTADGTFVSETTLTLTSDDLAKLLPRLERRAVVVHGAFIGDTYDVSLPVACGQLHADGNE
jgi:hypothetical protein